MREFDDPEGRRWIASVEERGGLDYKGAFHLVMRPADGGDPVELQDVRWNSSRSARRTLETMSVVELRRRLRAAAGRSAADVS
jgi:hypothetical protein